MLLGNSLRKAFNKQINNQWLRYCQGEILWRPLLKRFAGGCVKPGDRRRKAREAQVCSLCPTVGCAELGRKQGSLWATNLYKDICVVLLKCW